MILCSNCISRGRVPMWFRILPWANKCKLLNNKASFKCEQMRKLVWILCWTSSLIWMTVKHFWACGPMDGSLSSSDRASFVFSRDFAGVNRNNGWMEGWNCIILSAYSDTHSPSLAKCISNWAGKRVVRFPRRRKPLIIHTVIKQTFRKDWSCDRKFGPGFSNQFCQKLVQNVGGVVLVKGKFWADIICG